MNASLETMKFKLIIAWLWIAIPLAWGVCQSVKKSLPLFRGAVISKEKK